MQIILLKGKPGTLKTSVWGAAIKSHFEVQGARVLYVDYQDETTGEFAALLSEVDPDVVIIDTFYDEMPFIGFCVTRTITVEDAEHLGYRNDSDKEALLSILVNRTEITIGEAMSLLGIPRESKDLSAMTTTARMLVEHNWMPRSLTFGVNTIYRPASVESTR